MARKLTNMRLGLEVELDDSTVTLVGNGVRLSLSRAEYRWMQGCVETMIEQDLKEKLKKDRIL